MNLRQPNANEAVATSNRSRDVSPISGICTRCVDGCRGGCEIWLASFRGREVLYPGPFGEITAGADKNYPVDYSHLNIQGYAVGAEGLPEGVEASARTPPSSPSVNTETEYGWTKKVKMKRADLHRRARLDRDRPQELGALRRSARPSPASRSSAARTSAASTRGWSCDSNGKVKKLAGDGPPDRDLPEVTTRATARSSSR